MLIVAGVILTAGLRLLAVRADRAQADTTQSHQEAIKTALIAYLGRTKRLPCPDTDLDGRENRKVASPLDPCVAYAGTVPYLDLGLDRAGVQDGWDDYIRFVVSPPQSSPAPPVTVPQWTTAWLFSYASAVTDADRQTNAASQAFWPTTSTGAIVVRDVNNNSIADPTSSPPTGAVVVLISHGKNGMGAVNIKGAQNDSTAAGSDEARNIAPVVAAGPPAQIVVYNRDFTDQDVPGHGTFDDLVMVIRREDLISPLTANGTLKGSADLALSQANDIVIGKILSARGAGPPCTYKYSLPTAPVTFAGLSADWGVAYSVGGTSTIDCTTGGAAQAYTLTTGDGSSRTITLDEIAGVLTRAAVFN